MADPHDGETGRRAEAERANDFADDSHRQSPSARPEGRTDCQFLPAPRHDQFREHVNSNSGQHDRDHSQSTHYGHAEALRSHLLGDPLFKGTKRPQPDVRIFTADDRGGFFARSREIAGRTEDQFAIRDAGSLA